MPVNFHTLSPSKLRGTALLCSALLCCLGWGGGRGRVGFSYLGEWTGAIGELMGVSPYLKMSDVLSHAWLGLIRRLR